MVTKKRRRLTTKQLGDRVEKLLKTKKTYPITEKDFDKVLKNAFPENKKNKK